MAGITALDEFIANETVYDAVLRNLEIIGEAASKVNEPTKQQLPRIPWRDIVGFRHVLAHGYGVINDDLVWQIIHDRVPELQRELEQYFDENPKGE